MDFEIETVPAGVRARMRGRLTFTENESFRRMLTALAAAHAGGGRVVLDLDGVSFIDSAGLGLLLHARDLLRRRSARVMLSGAAGQVGRMLALARFDDLFDQAA